MDGSFRHLDLTAAIDGSFRLFDLTAETLTKESLKRAFKHAALRAHPDKGGVEFDRVIDAYTRLSSYLRHRTGGRENLAVLDVAEIEQARQRQFEQELNNMVMDVFDSIDNTQPQLTDAFHAAFEQMHMDTRDRYQEMMEDPMTSQWLQGHAVPVMAREEMMDHQVFEATKVAAPVTTIVALEELATYSRPTGTLLLPSVEDSLDTAYELCPAIPQRSACNFEEMVALRQEIAPITDVEMEERAAYEQQQAEREKEHQMRITDYFRTTGSSVWALRAATMDDSFIKTV